MSLPPPEQIDPHELITNETTDDEKLPTGRKRHISWDDSKTRVRRQCTRSAPLLCRAAESGAKVITRDTKKPSDKSRYITPKYSVSARMAKPHPIASTDITTGFTDPELSNYAEEIANYIHKVLKVRVMTLDQHSLTDYVFKQCVTACEDTIDRGTFSIDYPRTCLNRILQAENSKTPQCHGMALVAGDQVLAWICTDANGGIGNFRGTLASIKRSTIRKPQNVTPFMRTLLEIPNFKKFVHVKTVVTRSDQRGKGFGKILLLYALIYWAERAKTQAFLNMALEKTFNKTTKKVDVQPSAASKRLYEMFQFYDVYPKFTESGESRFSLNEGHQGRLMVNVDIMETIRSVANVFGFSRMY